MAIPLTSTEAATSLASTVVPTAVAVLGSVVFTVAGVTVDVVVCVAVAAVCVLETVVVVLPCLPCVPIRLVRAKAGAVDRPSFIFHHSMKEGLLKTGKMTKIAEIWRKAPSFALQEQIKEICGGQPMKILSDL